MRPRVTTIILSAALLLVAGCSSNQPAAGPTTTATVPATPRTLTVFAAASLKQTFTSMGTTFQEQNPGVTVTFNFAGSQTLVSQIQSGAAADVFASADERNMTAAVDAKLTATTPVLFASNTLVIVTPPDNPARITTLADIAKPGVKLVVCAPAVPCGAATQKVAQSANLTLKPVSEEQAVTDVLAKVQAGEADAGLVYATDAKGAKAGSVTTVTFPESSAIVNKNPIAVLKDSTQPDLAQKFVDLVTGPTGQKVLADAGFGQGKA